MFEKLVVFLLREILKRNAIFYMSLLLFINSLTHFYKCNKFDAIFYISLTGAGRVEKTRLIAKN